VGWCQNNEKELGAARKFSFKHIQTKQKIDTVLEADSLLIMKGKIQENWLHSLPKTTKVKFPRVNLTFRNIYT
jgi:alkylated DNA repair dioxygenase AlkB